MEKKSKKGFRSIDKKKAQKIQSAGGKARWEKYRKEKLELEKLREGNEV
jgi:hypothetical protein